MNIQGLISQKQKNKMTFLKEIAQSDHISFISITESHLHPAINDTEIHIPGFSLLRSDRNRPGNNCPRGGACIYIKEDLVVDYTERFTNGTCEVICVSIKSLSTNIITFYRPPETDYAKSVEALAFTENFVQSHPNDFNNIILGDFNLPEKYLKWFDGDEDGGIPIPSVQDSKQESIKFAETVVEFMTDFGLTQHILEPTRINEILDLCFTNDSELIENIMVTGSPQSWKTQIL